MLSDAFKLMEVFDKDGEKVEGLMMCESKNVAVGGDDIDIGCGNSFGGSGEEEGAEDVQTVNNIIERFSYTETQLGAADFKAWIKEYMVALRGKMRTAGVEKEKIQAFMATAPGIAKFFLKNFSDVQFYLGPSFCADTMCFAMYNGEALTPNFYYIMEGVDETKF